MIVDLKCILNKNLYARTQSSVKVPGSLSAAPHSRFLSPCRWKAPLVALRKEICILYVASLTSSSLIFSPMIYLYPWAWPAVTCQAHRRNQACVLRMIVEKLIDSWPCLKWSRIIVERERGVVMNEESPGSCEAKAGQVIPYMWGPRVCMQSFLWDGGLRDVVVQDRVGWLAIKTLKLWHFTFVWSTVV